MATLRLFASLREIAGTSKVDLDAATVGAVLDLAVEQYGERFAAGLATAQVWVNGNQADRDTALTATDEVAVIPPVSGGAAVVTEAPDMIRLLLTLVVGATVFIANLVSTETLALAAVGAVIAWLWDVADTYALRRPAFQIVPAMVAGSIGATAAYRWGEPGLAGGVAVGAMVALAWAVFDRTNRGVDALSISTLLAGVAALASGSLVIVRLRSEVEVTAFVAIATAAAVAAWFGRRYGGASLDPNLAMLLVTLLAGTAAGATAGSLDLIVMLLVAPPTSGGLLAGRALGSLIRNGDVLHNVRAPGLLTMLDSAVFGVTLYWVALLLFSSVGAT